MAEILVFAVVYDSSRRCVFLAPFAGLEETMARPNATCPFCKAKHFVYKVHLKVPKELGAVTPRLCEECEIAHLGFLKRKERIDAKANKPASNSGSSDPRSQ
jgi:hypothetical protein